MKFDEKTIKDLLAVSVLASTVARVEACALDVKDSAERTPGSPSIDTEVNEIIGLSRKIADKLGLSEQVKAVRELQEAQFEASKQKNEALKKLADSFSPLVKNLTDPLDPSKIN